MKDNPQAAKSGYQAPERPRADEFVGTRVALLTTRWNVEIVAALKDGALRGLRDWGVVDGNIGHYHVPGAYELPLASEALMRKGRCDGVIALGVVIRGETPHFEIVSNECARGLREASQRHSVPLGFGVLAVETARQAADRSGSGRDNKGYEAAAAMLEMVRLLRALDGTARG